MFESTCVCLFLKSWCLQWCPPCRALLPELRKASIQLAGQMRFGTLDCTIHHHLCSTVNLYHTQTVPFLLSHHITNVFHVYLCCVSTISKPTPQPSYSTAHPSTSMRDTTPLMGYWSLSRYAFYIIYINMTHCSLQHV